MLKQEASSQAVSGRSTIPMFLGPTAARPEKMSSNEKN
jgi:hypothetical protein